ncbi:hypothetical protein SCARD494_05779 [Seiridium cardinale]
MYSTKVNFSTRYQISARGLVVHFARAHARPTTRDFSLATDGITIIIIILIIDNVEALAAEITSCDDAVAQLRIKPQSALEAVLAFLEAEDSLHAA